MHLVSNSYGCIARCRCNLIRDEKAGHIPECNGSSVQITKLRVLVPLVSDYLSLSVRITRKNYLLYEFWHEYTCRFVWRRWRPKEDKTNSAESGECWGDAR